MTIDCVGLCGGCFPRLLGERRVNVVVVSPARGGPAAESTTALFLGDLVRARDR